MSVQIKTPTFAESISEGTVATWHKAVGDAVRRDEVLVDVETDKVVIEIFAPTDGVLADIAKAEGETVHSEELLGLLTEAGAEAGDEPDASPAAGEAAPVPSAAPAARKLAAESGVDLAEVAGTGRQGRITKPDVRQHLQTADAPSGETEPEPTATPVAPPAPEPAPPAEAAENKAAVADAVADAGADESRVERRVPMTRLRASIAERLVAAQRTAAMLTTFNEVDMQPVMTMRKRYGEAFQARHNGTKLGFMGFFVRAAVEALKRFPAVNASVDGDDIVYHGYYDIGVAVSTERGLVVPVVRDADALGLHQIEQAIAEYGARARDGKLTLEEMQGGTFTISNGGVFGSLLSTPILNPPQTGILGMHKIEPRPVVVDGEVVVRPMMYLALSYDHRLIDGREAVRFLVTVKDLIEDPARVLLEL